MDLSPFHSSPYVDQARHPFVLAPFSLGDWTYSTDGFLCVRVPRRPDIPELAQDPRFPRFEAPYWHLFPKKLFTAPILPPPILERHPCPHCDAEGRVCDCPECHGNGEIAFHNGHHLYNGIECQTCEGGGYLPAAGLTQTPVPRRTPAPPAGATAWWSGIRMTPPPSAAATSAATTCIA
jgi:hypothetical protein